MGFSTSERLTQRFYEWEQRGRGRLLHDSPIAIEPPFYPFFGHYLPPVEVVDDGYRPGMFGQIYNLFFKRKKETAEEPESDIPPIEHIPVESDASLVAIGIVLPKEQKVEMDEMEQLILMLSMTSYPVSFEILATQTSIRLQFVCREQDALQVRSQVKAFFPSALLIDKTETGLNVIDDVSKVCFLDFGLSDEFMLPLQMPKDFDPDSFTGLCGSLECLDAGESITIQILFQGTVNPWAESIMRAVSDGTGGSFFSNAPEMAKLAREKISYPLYGVNIRLAVQAATHARTHTIAGIVAASVVQITKSQSNELMPLPLPDEAKVGFFTDIECRETHRAGMLLNLRELATLVHLPSHTVVSSKVERIVQKTKAAPAITKGNEFVLGENIHQGTSRIVTLPSSIRTRHMHLIGATGTGKSTFLQNLICEDLRLGNGLCLIDPHGDLVDGILSRIPEDRIQDCIVFDPSDAEYPIGFNILSAHSDIERDILSSDLVAVFRKQSMAWGDQMNSVLANAILAFLESMEGGTLADLRRFLLESSYRTKFLKTVKDPSIVYYWQHTFPILKYTSIGPIMSRLDTFLRPKIIRNMVAQKRSLDFETIMDGRKILLVKLSQGLIGTENSYLLGSFIVSKIYQAAMARQAKSQSERNEFFLYIDEFQNYVTPSLSAILAGGRKYALGLVLAHQEMQQIQKHDSELASAVITNPATRVCFRLGDIDAKKFEDGFSFFVARDLQDLKTGEAIVRIDRPDYDFNLSVTPLPYIDTVKAAESRQAVIQASRSKYGTPKQEVEAQFAQLGTIPKVVEEPVHPVQEIQTQKLTPAPPPKPVQIQPGVMPAPKQETRHRYLQNYIKKMAESRGHIARIEEQVPAGNGRVDVSLERAGKKIACEVSVTTDDVWEAHNIEKCLNAGYSMVIVCSEDAKALTKIRRQIQERFTEEQQQLIHAWMPEEVIAYLDGEIAKEASTEMVMKGYRVKVEYGTSKK